MFHKALIISILAFVFSCQTKEVIVQTDDTNFYPIEKGLFWEYAVSDEIYTVSANPQKLNYLIRERIGDSYNLNGNEVFRLERYSRSSTQSAWKLDSIWTIQKTLNKVIRTENNQAFLKMVFPIQEGIKWEINGSKSASYVYKNTFKAFGKEYGNTVSVIEKNDSTAINLNRKYEVYSLNNGMIYKEDTSLEYCQITPACIGKGQIDFGRRRIFRLTRKGSE